MASKYPLWVPTLVTQHQKREEIALANPDRKPEPLETCIVKPVALRPTAEDFITKYEYLGELGASTRAAYGLFTETLDLVGVECFGVPPTDMLAKKFCSDNPSLLICLERGACAPWAPRGAAGFLLKRSLKLAYRDHQWEVVIAYADENAGEIGGVYRNNGWFYMGRDVGRGGQKYRVSVIRPGEDVPVQTRKHRQAGYRTRAEAEAAGWRFVLEPTKHLFVRFIGEPLKAERRRRDVAARFGFHPFPIRGDSAPEA